MHTTDNTRLAARAAKGSKLPAQTLVWSIGIIWFFALVARAACAIFFSGMIDGEGAEYGRIAQNLLAGVGYVGIATEGEQLFFPPLFPFLISAVNAVTGDTEIAGRAVSACWVR